MWRDVPGLPGYQVSDLGHIHSFWRRAGEPGSTFNTWRSVLPDRPRLLVVSFAPSHGYGTVCIRNAEGRPVSRHVHVLVLETFVGPRPAGQQCRHLDGNKENNRLTNLAWG